METLYQDFRYGLRTLRANPGFTLVAVLALTLGIGANAAMFTIVNAVLLRPLPYPQSDRLVYLREAFKKEPGMSFSYPEFQDYHNLNHVFEGMAAVQGNAFNLTGVTTPEQLDGRSVTQEFLGTLRVRPILGRDFTPQDDRPGASPTAILSYGLWQRRFGGDAQVLGKSLTLDGQDYTVIGVLPKDFSYRDAQPDIFVPLGLRAGEEWAHIRTEHNGIYCVARLKSGVTLQQAQADLDAIAASLARQYPVSNTNVSLNALLLRERTVAGTRPALLLLLGAVVCVLLIACANVANLLLTRATVRERELAIRSALGAGRVRLIRQLLTESMVLALLGGGLGILLASWAIHILVAAAPDALPRVHEIHLDGTVLAFTAGISILTGVVFGIMPALHGSAYSAIESLKQGITSSAAGQRKRLRGSLVIAEVALSLVLLVGAGLLIHSFARVLEVDPGFNSHNVLTAVVAFPEKGKPDPVKVEAFFNEVYRNLQSQPGVEHAGAATPLPLSGNEWDTGYRIEGRPAPLPGEGVNTRIYHVSADYLATMRIPILKGRGFLESDIDGSLPVAIVSREFVKRNFPDEDPIGHKVRLGAPQDLSSPDETKYPWLTIVGIAGDVKHDSLDSQTPIELYQPYTQHYGGNTQGYRYLVVRGFSDNPLTLAPAMRNAVRQANPDVPIASIESMDQLVSDSLGSRKMSMSLLMTFAALALTLALIGIYGVISYSVTQRTREIGIRMALGARQHEVLALILRQAFRLVGIGLGIGIVLALLLSFTMSRFLNDQLFGIKATDPVTFISIAALLSIAALAASGIPARRASKVNPVVALRHE